MCSSLSRCCAFMYCGRKPNRNAATTTTAMTITRFFTGCLLSRVAHKLPRAIMAAYTKGHTDAICNHNDAAGRPSLVSGRREKPATCRREGVLRDRQERRIEVRRKDAGGEIQLPSQRRRADLRPVARPCGGRPIRDLRDGEGR